MADRIQLRGLTPSKQPAWLIAAFGLSVGIAIAAVIRRSMFLIRPAGGHSGITAIDATFLNHRTLTFFHIIPAAAFVALAAILLLRSPRSVLLKQAFYYLGLWTGLTAYVMNAYAIGGMIERSAVVLFNTLFLLELARAWRLKLERRWTEERIWMVRAVGVLLGIATTRPVMGVFFATQSISHLRPEQFFGVAFWIGFSLNTLGIEIWLQTRKRMAS